MSNGRSGVVMSGEVGVLVLIEWKRGSRLAGFARLAFGRLLLRGTPGLVFAKSLGTGVGGGFGLAPSFSHHGLMLSFTDEAAADAFLESRRLSGHARHAASLFTVKLRAFSSRGQWSGREPFAISADPPRGPVAALTRGSVRASRLMRFWSRAPASHRAVEHAPGCLLTAGLGEAPLLRQATFSIWSNVAAMNAYARSGAHLEAIKAAKDEEHFSESLFARFVPYDARGTWLGRGVDLRDAPA